MRKSIAIVAALFAITAALAAPGAALAQGYPNRPISFIWPYAAGSLSDVAWRSIVQEASRRIGQTIVFENRPGAGGRLGFDVIMRAKPDGYIIGAAPNALTTVQPLIDPKLYVEPDKHYVQLVTGIETYLLFVARSSAPFRDLNGLIAYAKANPGKLNAGTPGAGTGSHLAMAMLSARAGIDYTTVHYKGSAPVMTAMLSGEVDITVADPAAKPHIDSGRLVGIATTGPQRWNVFPALPTMQEAGAAGFYFASWHGVIVPIGLPADVGAALNKVFNEALATPELKSRLEAAGWVVKGGTAAEATALIRSELDALRPVIRAANIKLD